MKYYLLLLLLLIPACASEEAVAPENPVQPIKPEPTPTIEEEVEFIPEPEPIVEQEENPFVIPDEVLTRVSCVGTSLSFTITNTLEIPLSMESVSFEELNKKQKLIVTINNYDPWSPGRYFSEQSLKDCLPVELAPGETFDCTVKPIPIVTPNAYSQNTILVQSTKIREQATFTC